MNTLYIDCGMGAAGDMLGAALLELLPDRQAFVDRMNGLGLPGVRITMEQSVKCGITGTHLRVTVEGVEEDEHLHSHEEHHHHGHRHSHSSMDDIEDLVYGLPLPTMVKLDILSVYELIAQAESQVHGVPVTQIHFHEVGTMDAVADITAVCLLMYLLKPDRVIASPVHVGSGTVRCAHGILPVPAPATARILLGIPSYGGEIQGELCTPTGAALLKHFVTDYGPQPPMVFDAIGYGMGRKDFPQANCVRCLLGTVPEQEAAAPRIAELCCNLDDMTGEEIGFAVERLLEAGALDVFTSPIGMKKSRPGVMLSVLCREAERDCLAALLLKYTTTLGVRMRTWDRVVLNRQVQTVNTPYGPVRKKVSTADGIHREKWEYDDLSAIAKARGISLREAEVLLEQG